MQRPVPLLVVTMLAALPAWGQARVEIEPSSATVGDPLTVRMTIEATDGIEPVREKLGPQLGPFTVLDERWSAATGEEASGWSWTATVAAYRTGELEFPALSVASSGGGEGWQTEALQVDVVSVLEDGGSEAEEAPEIADLKAPASIAPNFAPLWLAGGLLGLLLAVTALAWWLHRRYAARLAAAPAVEDPFARTPPHEWAFAALQELLEERGALATDRFYARLSWILKRYLGARYRVDLLEHTSDEVCPLLEQAVAPGAAVARVNAVLADCDAVKFAKYDPGESERKDIVERVYRIVDRTKPAEPRPEVQRGAA